MGYVESDRTRFPIDDITHTMLWHCHVSTQISTHSGSARSCLHDYDQMEILLEAAQARQTLPARAASVLRVLALRALPTTFAETRSSTPSQYICLPRPKSLISSAICFHPSLFFSDKRWVIREKLLFPSMYINVNATGIYLRYCTGSLSLLSGSSGNYKHVTSAFWNKTDNVRKHDLEAVMDRRPGVYRRIDPFFNTSDFFSSYDHG